MPNAISLGSTVLELTTDASKLEGGLNKAKGSVEGWAGGVTGVAKGAAIAIAGIGTAALGILGAMTASAISVSQNVGEVSRLGRELGLTTQEASKLRFAGTRLGMDVDELSAVFKKFEGDLVQNKDRYADLGIQIAKNKQGNIDFLPTLGNVADRFKNMPDGVEKSSLAVELFGKKGLEMIPFLNKGKTGLEDLGKEAERLGLVFDDKTVAASKRLGLAQKELKTNIDAVKTHIGVAFLPVLAEWSGYLLSLANAVLPKVFTALGMFEGWVRIAIGVVKELVDVAMRTRPEAGGILASIIGQANAAEFMGLVKNIRDKFDDLMEKVIKPGLLWLDKEGRAIWDNIRDTISAAWSKIEPKLLAFSEKMGQLKDRFDALPAPFKSAMEQIALSAVIVKTTGLDEWILGIASGISGAGGVTQGILAMKGHWIAAGAAFVTTGAIILAIASIAVAMYQIFSAIGEVRDNWERLRSAVHAGMKENDNQVQTALVRLVQWGDAFDRLGTKTRESLLAWGEMFRQLGLTIGIMVLSVELVISMMWRGILVITQTTINNMIDTINPLWTMLGNPPISHINFDLPNIESIEAQITYLRRDQSMNLYVNLLPGANSAFPGQGMFASGTDHITRGPELFMAGEAGPERVQVTPLAKGTAGMDGAPTLVRLYLNGRVFAEAMARAERAGEVRFGGGR